MKKQILGIVTLITLLGIVGYFAMANDNEETTEATVEIVELLNLTESTKLRFGQVAITGATNLALTINADGTTDLTGGGDLDHFAGSDFGAATYTVTGSNNGAVKINLPTSIIMTGPGVDIPVNNFTSSETNEEFTLDGSGNGGFSVGATATFDASQIDGSYSGTFNLDVIYQ